MLSQEKIDMFLDVLKKKKTSENPSDHHHANLKEHKLKHDLLRFFVLGNGFQSKSFHRQTLLSDRSESQVPNVERVVCNHGSLQPIYLDLRSSQNQKFIKLLLVEPSSPIPPQDSCFVGRLASKKSTLTFYLSKELVFHTFNLVI